MLVPNNCLKCGASWRGGHEVPGKKMKIGLRVFYKCFGSLCIQSIEHSTKYYLLIRCGKENGNISS